MDNQDWPITGVVVVADINRCPAGFTTIDKTFDGQEEADLWRDNFFSKRVTRYLCVERTTPQPGKDVLVDVSLINERDPIPPGFTVVDYTVDTREKAIKKKVMCVRWMSSSLTMSAISELIILTRGTRRPPTGYTMVGELNNFMMCYKMANIRTTAVENSEISMNDMAKNLPYALNPTEQAPMGYSATQGQAAGYTAGRRAPPERSMSSLTGISVTPLSGVPWQLNPKFQEFNDLKNVHIPEIRYKTIMDIEQQYEYNFVTERQTASTRIPNDLR